MTHIGSVLTRIKQKFFIDGNGNPVKVGSPICDQIRYPDPPGKAACDVPGLTGEQVYHLKKEGEVTIRLGNEMIHFEIMSALDYDRQYREQTAKRDKE